VHGVGCRLCYPRLHTQFYQGDVDIRRGPNSYAGQIGFSDCFVLNQSFRISTNSICLGDSQIEE